MGIRSTELANPNSCFNKAADDEPIFVLRGKDAFSATLVRTWAAMYKQTHCTCARGNTYRYPSHAAGDVWDDAAHKAKYEHAIALANQMDDYPNRAVPT